MYHLKDSHNAIVYKYNKYMQVNGTLFYAFEYLLKTLEVNPDSNIRWYIIIPSNQQKDYLEKLRCVFNTKYPLWNIKTKNRLELEKVRTHYGFHSPEYSNFVKLTTLLNKAFDRIKLVTSLELLRLNLNNVLFPSWNSWFDTALPKTIKSINVFQNRLTKSIYQDLTTPIVNHSVIPTTFWYETTYQELPFGNQKKYNIKLGTEYFYPKDLFVVLRPKGQNRKSNIIAGIPIVTSLSMEKTKVSLFAQVQPGIYLDVRRIEYYQNFNRFEENSRIIPEARFYGIQILVNKVKDIQDLNICRAFNSDIGVNDYDSSVPRLKNNLDEYILEDNDPIISILKEN